MKQAFTLFSDYFAMRDNWLTRFDARVKVVATIASVLAVVFSTRPVLPLLAMALSFAGMLSIRVPLRVAAVRFMPVMGVLLVLVGMRSFMVGATPVCCIHVFGRDLVMTAEGLHEAAVIGSRVAGAVSIIMLSSFITPAPGLYAALLWFRMPRMWVELAGMIYRYVFVILDRASDTIIAQRARLGYTGIRRSLHTMGLLGGTVFLRAFEQAERTHRAMVARCYNGAMPVGRLEPLGMKRWIGLPAICVGAALLYAACEGGLGL